MNKSTCAETHVPVKCRNCEHMSYVPEYRFINGLWCGEIRKTLDFECPQCHWREKIIL